MENKNFIKRKNANTIAVAIFLSLAFLGVILLLVCAIMLMKTKGDFFMLAHPVAFVICLFVGGMSLAISCGGLFLLSRKTQKGEKSVVCPSCKKKLSERLAFCPYCGKQLNPKETEHTNTKENV